MKFLGDVCEIIGGGTPSKKVAAYFGGEIPWATVGDMNVEQLSATDLNITHAGLENSSSKVIPSGNVIIATRVGLGKSCILNVDTAINQDLKGLVPKSSVELLPRFIFRWTQSIAPIVIAAGTGATVQGVKIKFVAQLPIPVPPIEEQERIVALLDSAFEKIDKAKANVERNLKNAEELFQSVLDEVFSNPGEDWEVTSLGEACVFIDYRGRTPKKTDNGTRLITAKNVRMGFVKIDPEEFISSDEYEEWMTRGFPKKGDVLFTTEAPLANVAVFDFSEKVALAQRIITLSPKAGLIGGFLSFHLQSRPSQVEILGHATGATVSGIKSKLLKLVKVAFPPVVNQKEIVSRLDALSGHRDEVVAKCKKELIDLEEMRHSILEQAFVGKLTSTKSQ